MTRPPEMFPIALDLTGRRCVVVGAGRVGASKLQSLLRTGANIVVVAPEASPEAADLMAKSQLEWHRRDFVPEDLDGACLVVAATSSPAVNESVWREARKRNVLCNVVDDPAHCDFFYPAVVRRGVLQIAISTSGIAPSLSRRIRERLEKQFAPEYSDWLELVKVERRHIIETVADASERRRRIEELTTEDNFAAFTSRGSSATTGL